jgi:dTDP-4-dehydrorhamnose reductase
MIIIGKTGQLARSYSKLFAENGAPASFMGREELDLSAPNSVMESLDRVISQEEKRHSEKRNRVLINTAAYTAVDRAENEIELARAINASSVARMAEWAHKHDFLLIHYSTDYVFDGSGSIPWKETDTPNPLNTYGITKLEGEYRIHESSCRHLIFRTSWVYERDGKNFLNTISKLAKERDSLRIVVDQVGAPTWSTDLASYSLTATKRALLNPKLEGTYHLTNSGETSWFGFAKAILEHKRIIHPEIELAELIPVPSTEYPTPAKRPMNSRLHLSKFEKNFGTEIRDWKSALNSFFGL